MSKPIEIKFTLKAEEGDNVMALNYRCKPATWEPGKVMDVEVRVYKKDRRCSPAYRVMLDRKTGRFGDTNLFIHVDNDGIEQQR